MIAFVCVVLWALFWKLPKDGWHVQTVDDGEHTGYVTAIESEGIWWKTKNIYIKTDVSSSQEDRYCLMVSEDVEEKLRDTSRNGTKVTVVFKDYLIRGWANCSDASAAIVTGIK